MALRDIDETLANKARPARIARSAKSAGRSKRFPKRRITRSRSLPRKKETPKSETSSGNVLSQDPCVAVEAYRIDVLYRETARQVTYYEKLVKENRELWPAVGFCRYLIFSGVLDILKAHCSDNPRMMTDGANLCWRVEELQRDITERFKTGKDKSPEPLPEIESMQRKLDLIAGYLSKMTR